MDAYGRTSVPRDDARERRYGTSQRTRPEYATPYPTTIANPRASKRMGALAVLGRIASGIGAALIALVRLIVRGFERIWGASKAAGVGLVIVLVALIGFGIDGIAHGGRIYDGIRIGSIDVSHMTIDEATRAIDDAYLAKLDATTVYIFSNEEDLDNADIDLVSREEEALANQISLEEAQENKVFWIASAENLEATLPARELAEEALAIGRQENPFANILARFSDHEVGMRVSYDDKLLRTLVSDIDATISDPCVEFGIEVSDGIASVTEGHDGYQIDAARFREDLDELLLADEAETSTYIAQASYTPLRITREDAELTCAAVNEAIEQGASFVFDGAITDVDRATLGSWVTTSVSDVDGGHRLDPAIDVRKGMSSLVTNVNRIQFDGDINVTFVEDDGEVLVQPDRELTIPSLEDALGDLDADLFSSYRDTGEQSIASPPFDIEIETTRYAGAFSVEDALAFGIVEDFSEYTTQYISSSSTQNRIHNIHLACEMINDSIVPANGGVWSWNEKAGDTNATAGFKEASAIAGDEYTTTTGGGICQVATTVFNAVYESGLPIIERHNHTLYIGSYPNGRDAAIAYPILDLRWKNDTASDILMRTNYTETSVTVSLIGESPHLSVSTETGEWREGEEYVVKTEVEEGLAKDAYYKKTNGVDGSKIYVVRTVTDESGNVVSQDTFDSVYSPVNEVIAIGEGSDADAILERFKRADTADSSA